MLGGHDDLVTHVERLEESVCDFLRDRHLLERHGKVFVVWAQIGLLFGAPVQDVGLVTLLGGHLHVGALVFVREQFGHRGCGRGAGVQQHCVRCGDRSRGLSQRRNDGKGNEEQSRRPSSLVLCASKRVGLVRALLSC